MAKQSEVVVKSKDEASGTVVLVKPIYTGSGDARKKIDTFEASYLLPTATKVQVAGFIDKVGLAEFTACFNYGRDLRSRPAREGVETTVIKQKGVDIDLMTLPIETAIGHINGSRAWAAMGNKVSGAYAVAARKLIEAGKVQDRNGTLHKK